MWAAGEGYNQICIALLDAGAETDILNATNYTAGSDLNARNLDEAKKSFRSTAAMALLPTTGATE